MKAVKLNKEFPGYAKGQVVEMDDNSATVLIKRGDAVAVDNAPPKVLNLAGDPVEVADTAPAAEQPAAAPVADPAPAKGKA